MQTSATMPNSRQIIPSNVLGMVIFIVTEVMFFTALISAYLIVRAGAFDWPPPNQPRLPVGATALNSCMLLISGVLLYQSYKVFVKGPSSERTMQFLQGSILLGAVFVLIQGFEWINLIRFGLTMTSSTYGSFFYLIVGGHALHCLVALGGLIYVARQLKSGTLAPDVFQAIRLFWFFVVGLWPVLYYLVYLH